MIQRISRRTVLRGLGTALTLPWLESLAPVGRAAEVTRPPLRMAFLYVPNGIHMEDWTPAEAGTNFALPEILAPLEPFRDDLLVLTGLAQNNAKALGDGPGDHARSLAVFLTGVHPNKTDGADIRAGVSVDQFAAQRVGGATRFPSLELGIEAGRQAGNCDSGYSCAYSSNIAWRTPTTPVPKEINPKLVFDRLFGADAPAETAEARARRKVFRQSILDFVQDDARKLHARLGAADRQKLDEYLTSVRELETRIARSEQGALTGPEDFVVPDGIPRELPEHFRLMNDLLVLAFQGDLTRIATFVYANEGSNRNYEFLGVTNGHHELSHHGGDPEKHAKIRTINTFHITQLADFLGKMKAIREADGSTLLDNSMIVYGSGIGDGNRHNHDELPVLLAGKGGGTIVTGRHLEYPRDTPMTNLYLAMLDRIGAPTDSFGDSTGRLEKLDNPDADPVVKERHDGTYDRRRQRRRRPEQDAG